MPLKFDDTESSHLIGLIKYCVYFGRFVPSCLGLLLCAHSSTSVVMTWKNAFTLNEFCIILKKKKTLGKNKILYRIVYNLICFQRHINIHHILQAQKLHVNNYFQKCYVSFSYCEERTKACYIEKNSGVACHIQIY